jgi:putative transposase
VGREDRGVKPLLQGWMVTGRPMEDTVAMSARPTRGHSQLRKGRVSLAGATYFLTMCVRHGDPHATGDIHLNATAIHTALLELAGRMRADGTWTVRCSTLMPDHLHAVVRLGDAVTLSDALRLFRGRSSVILRRRGLQWQPGVFEHRLRPQEPLLPFFHYIFMNPYRKGLLPQSDPWPFFRCDEEDRAWFDPLTNEGVAYPEWLNP